MLTLSQIRWAARHDWFLRANGGGSITVQDWLDDGRPGSPLLPVPLHFTGDFQALRDWAGY